MEMRQDQEQRYGFCVAVLVSMQVILQRVNLHRERAALNGLTLTVGLNLAVQFVIAILPQAPY